ncbi:nucleoside hydrolase [Companilactobacillus mishanensis]|uniref:nucleoside hydrolase n=1 Tax=Companilactobacillus mishanensis TaxID=2486008 RepID=UPI001294A3F0|nr:nucleoside hydrolase [Companilactobacillus mishanensis]MQS88870.1 hypothetical protein [Companilactobacillus mishanensis]
MKLIYDCDNTMGLKEKDVDDGLALLYLNKQSDIDILGLTLTFGNGTVKQVEQQTSKMVDMFDLKMPYYLGNEKDSKGTSPAAEYLVEQVNKYPGEIIILATGSLRNMKDAQDIDSNFYDKVAQIVIMGGRFDDLFINNIHVDELNFSICPAGFESVFKGSTKLTIVSGQYISDKPTLRSDFRFLKSSDDDKNTWLHETLSNWMVFNQKIWQLDGFVNWDTLTAFAITKPDYFKTETVTTNNERADFSTGLIVMDPSGDRQINLVTDVPGLTQINLELVSALNSYL